jgi:hypothetical protein
MNTDECRRSETRMETLAPSFPTLEPARGIHPWDPNALDAWAANGAPSGAVDAAAFVLGV